jgi:serine protease Do
VAVSQIAPGNSITLGILRDGKPDTINVKVGEFKGEKQVADNDSQGSRQGGRLGLAATDLTPDVRSQLNIPSQVNGAAIQSVRPASPADDAGLAPGDVILEVNRHKVDSAENFSNTVHSLPADKDILLLVWSRGGASYRVVHPEQGNQNGM